MCVGSHPGIQPALGADREGVSTAVVEAPVAHECADCGTAFELSARRARDHRKRGTTPKCDRCRHGAKPPKVTEAHRRYWLDRFSLDEIRELAAEIWAADELS